MIIYFIFHRWDDMIKEKRRAYQKRRRLKKHKLKQEQIEMDTITDDRKSEVSSFPTLETYPL